jgi:hypothetical protein
MCSITFRKCIRQWGAHDVGVQEDGHHAGCVLRIVSELLELDDGVLGIPGCLVMLNQHHRDVIAFLCRAR